MIVKSTVFGDAHAEERPYWRSKKPESLGRGSAPYIERQGYLNANPRNPPLDYARGILKSDTPIERGSR